MVNINSAAPADLVGIVAKEADPTGRAAIAASALVLAVVGIYGVMAYSVAERTREIGVRIALGARRGQVAAMVVREALPTAAAGIAAGLVATWGADAADGGAAL